MDTGHDTLPSPRWSRRGIARLLGGGVALVGSSRGLAAPKQDKKKFRTKTKTFTNATPITINDSATPPTLANPYPSEIRVSGFKQGELLDVNVTLTNLSHSWSNDIDVLLRAPNGRRAIIMSDAGTGLPVTNLTLTLDDQAAARLPVGSPLGSGRFKPANYDDGTTDVFPGGVGTTANVKLATFQGINPNGIWQLFVLDDTTNDSGEIGAG